jgi:Arc/MetJ family transcription regulator
MFSRHLQDFAITPQGSSPFERVARRLGLSPSQYVTSAKLKKWVRKNKDHKYVPLQLLEAWHFHVDDELFGKTAKAFKLTA